jgi:(p)ppGpp synthase/HD superfamily hydrolase
LFIEAGGTEDEAIAALLHDAVEDAGGDETLAEIRAIVGHEVAGVADERSHPR